MTVKPGLNSDGSVVVSIETFLDDEARLRAAFGTLSKDFVERELLRICNFLRIADGGDTYEQELNAVVALLQSAAPKTEIEALLIIQMAALHVLLMRKAGHLLGCKTIDQQESNSTALARLTKAFAGHCDTLSRMRRNGRQKVTVEHVHIHAGAQAIVGNVEQPNRGGRGGGR